MTSASPTDSDTQNLPFDDDTSTVSQDTRAGLKKSSIRRRLLTLINSSSQVGFQDPTSLWARASIASFGASYYTAETSPLRAEIDTPIPSPAQRSPSVGWSPTVSDVPYGLPAPLPTIESKPTPRVKFSKSGLQTISEDKSHPPRSQSDGFVFESRSFFRNPRRTSSAPLPAQPVPEQRATDLRPPPKCEDIVVEMPAAFQGAHTTIYRGKIAGELVAVRAMLAIKALDGTRRELERDRPVWFNMAHENVQPLLGVVLRPDFSPYECTVSPWYQNGSLSVYAKRQKMPRSLRVRLIQDVVEGLRYLHSLDPPIIHGRLKPSNVLIDANDRAIICDFGIAQRTQNGLSKDTLVSVSKVNSIRYIAPELVTGANSKVPTTYSDVWSLACIIYEITYSRPPYANIEATGNASQLALFTELGNGRSPAKRPSNISKEEALLWKSVLEPSWSTRLNKRPTVAWIRYYLDQHANSLSAVLS